MKLFNPDANTESTSSVDSATQATVASADAKTQEGSASSAEQTQDAKQESLADVVKKFKADLAEKDKTTEGEQSESSTEGEKKAESAVLEKNGTEAEAPKTEQTDDSKLPFHTHPRWQQMVKEKTELSTKVQELEKYRDAGTRMQNVETFCQTNNISAHEYDNILKTWALVKSNPAEGLKKLQQTVQALQIHLGEALPSDLQQAVDDGKIDVEFAKATAKLRLEAAQLKSTSTRTEEQQQQRQVQEVRNAIEGWKNTVAKADASFKPKASPDLPDGKFELVNMKFSSLWSSNPPQDMSGVVALCQRAYDEVNGFITQVSPRQPAKRPPSSQRSVQPTEQRIDTSKPGWAKKVAVQHLAAHAA